MTVVAGNLKFILIHLLSYIVLKAMKHDEY